MSEGGVSPDFPVVVPIEVRFRDTDAMGHVNNAVYFSYLEVARAHYWHRLLGLRSYRDVDFILARAEMDFKAPTYVGETLEVGIRIPSVGRTSFPFEYRIWKRGSGELVADARTIQVMYDYEAGKLKPITPELRATFEEFEGRGEK